MILGLCLGVAIWILFLLGHLLTMRVAAPAQRARIDRTLSLIGLLAVPTSVAVALPNLDYSAWSQGGWFMGMVWGILAYVALFTLYMPFFYTVIASLSVRTIILLAQESDGTLPIAFLFDQFSSRSSLLLSSGSGDCGRAVDVPLPTTQRGRQIPRSHRKK